MACGARPFCTIAKALVNIFTEKQYKLEPALCSLGIGHVAQAAVARMSTEDLSQAANQMTLPGLAQSIMKTNSAMIGSMQRMCDALESQNKLLKHLLSSTDENSAEVAVRNGNGFDQSAKKRKGRPPSSSTWKEYLKRYPDNGSIEHYSSLTQSEKNAIRIEAKKQSRDDEDDEDANMQKVRKLRREVDQRIVESKLPVD